MRRSGEAVRVRSGAAGGPAPGGFLWRGRSYVVEDVLSRWRERTAWWEHPALAAVHGGAGAPEGDPHGGAPEPDAEREVWRVEARPARGGATGVYDLCRPAPPGTAGAPAPLHDGAWRLLRVCD